MQQLKRLGIVIITSILIAIIPYLIGTFFISEYTGNFYIFLAKWVMGAFTIACLLFVITICIVLFERLYEYIKYG